VTEVEELSKRVEILESQKASWSRFFVQYLLSPLLVVLIGVVSTYMVERAGRSLQILELEVKRMEATRGFMQELFSGTPQRAFIAERLVLKIIADDKLGGEITAVVKDFYKGKFQQAISQKDLQEAKKISEAVQHIQSPASREIGRSLEQPSYSVVVASVSKEGEARSRAKQLREQQFKSGVILDKRGWYGVTLGRQAFQEALKIKKKAVESGVTEKDAYIITPDVVSKTIE